MIKPFYSTLTGTTTSALSRPGINSNQEVFYITESSRTGLMSYPAHLVEVSEMQSVYSTTTNDWAKILSE